MTKRHSARISTFGSQITSVISVALVLLILGILAMTLEASRSLSDDIRRNIGFVVKLSPSASADDVNRVKHLVSASPAIDSYVFASPDNILAEESRLMGEDLGEMLDENPFGAEFDVRLKPRYACGDSITAISAVIAADDAVDEIVTETAVVDSINSVIRRLTAILLAIAAALLIISFVLINNTVSLAIYSRRFIIHTMKLVGATGAFIRRPFLIAGLAAAALAIAVLAAIRAYSTSFDAALDSALPWPSMGWIFAGVLACGLLICLIASIIATNRYLRADYDEMFK